MIKRCLSFLLTAACLLPLFTAYADAIAEPLNDFYTRHRSECVYLGRSFYANGGDGYISLKKEPGSKTETAVIENGEIIHIMFTYNHGGKLWGVTEIYAEDKHYSKWPNGWVPMEQLLLVYDYNSFAEEHEGEFYVYSGDYSELKEAESIIMWAWPGSGVECGSIELEEDYYLNITHAYTDADGREWGFIGYWYGRRNEWVCLSEPSNANIPAFNAPPEPEFWQPADMPPSGGLPLPVWAIGLVAVLVAGTVILIRVFWKKP